MAGYCPAWGWLSAIDPARRAVHKRILPVFAMPPLRYILGVHSSQLLALVICNVPPKHGDIL